LDQILNQNGQKMSIERNILAPFQFKLFVSEYYLGRLYKAVL
jgi:hypothetical protein